MHSVAIIIIAVVWMFVCHMQPIKQCIFSPRNARIQFFHINCCIWDLYEIYTSRDLNRQKCKEKLHLYLWNSTTITVQDRLWPSDRPLTMALFSRIVQLKLCWKITVLWFKVREQQKEMWLTITQLMWRTTHRWYLLLLTFMHQHTAAQQRVRANLITVNHLHRI